MKKIPDLLPLWIQSRAPFYKDPIHIYLVKVAFGTPYLLLIAQSRSSSQVISVLDATRTPEGEYGTTNSSIEVSTISHQ